MSHTRARRASSLTIIGVLALAAALSGCGSSSVADVTTQAQKLATTIKSVGLANNETPLAFTRRAVISASKTDGTRENPVTLRVLPLFGKGVVLEGVKGYRAPSMPDSIIVTDGTSCASVTGTGLNGKNLDAVVKALDSCPAS